MKTTSSKPAKASKKPTEMIAAIAAAQKRADGAKKKAKAAKTILKRARKAYKLAKKAAKAVRNEIKELKEALKATKARAARAKSGSNRKKSTARNPAPSKIVVGEPAVAPAPVVAEVETPVEGSVPQS